MKKKTKKDFEKYIRGVINEYASKLMIQRHTIDIFPEVDDKKALMECKFAYPYLNNSIRYSNEAFEDWCKGNDMTPFVVHELCHIVTDPFYAKATERYVGKTDMEDERELLTDHICNIVLGIDNMGG